ncbi:hypothetical protein HU200_020134 [Digitaria exilis]|uniref:Myb-like domain-containing protein n=1 Tax=Digitaria exilis TaxID=1010633 RepID=A0A835F1C1_9POAL|nr:hypothetical protein HU200_020134 [Digitaria exilis]
MNYQAPHIHPNFHGRYPHNMTPFPGPSYHSLSPAPASYHGGPYPGNIGQYLPGMIGGFPANGPASISGQPLPPNPETEIEKWSDASEDEDEKKGGRIVWNQEDDLRLVSSWLKNSNDPVLGNGKKSARYWKDIADEYNKHAPQGQKRTAVQCKEHWNKIIPHINKFNGIYNDICSTYSSGQSEDQLMEKVRAKYKRVAKKKRPFSFEHWWRAIKDQPKWNRRAHPMEEMQKRCKLN